MGGTSPAMMYGEAFWRQHLRATGRTGAAKNVPKGWERTPSKTKRLILLAAGADFANLPRPIASLDLPRASLKRICEAPPDKFPSWVASLPLLRSEEHTSELQSH